jgi:hypothetical protein
MYKNTYALNNYTQRLAKSAFGGQYEDFSSQATLDGAHSTCIAEVSTFTLNNSMQTSAPEAHVLKKGELETKLLFANF